MWLPVRGAVLIPCLLYLENKKKTPLSHFLTLPPCLYGDSLSFNVSLPQRLPLFSKILFEFICFVRLPLCFSSLCSVNLWQTLLPFPACNQNSGAENLRGGVRKHIGKQHFLDIFISPFFWCLPFDSFHLLPFHWLKTNPFLPSQSLSKSINFSVFLLMTTLKADLNREGDEHIFLERHS